jgi:hypothetical protein
MGYGFTQSNLSVPILPVARDHSHSLQELYLSAIHPSNRCRPYIPLSIDAPLCCAMRKDATYFLAFVALFLPLCHLNVTESKNADEFTAFP